MRVTGNLLKMRAQLADPVIYHLPIANELIPMNELIGRNISLEFEHDIYCISCGKKTNKSFSQGFCYSCFISSPEAAECILRPELCLAHEGKGRDIGWERRNHLQDHFVYLAFSGAGTDSDPEVKVGVTRSTQVPVRWIDQGALAVICLAKTENRFLSGCIEVSLKKYLTDKTNWRKMLSAPKFPLTEAIVDFLIKKKKQINELLPAELKSYYWDEDTVTKINYPVLEYPVKINSIDLEKTPSVKGKNGNGVKITGIKGQYLIFEDGNVLNIRKHSGYVICLEY